ncbi:unnamed protein product [Vicia faba]|uniref:Uncharacterized protein n=1 Tax=Vicia faba TaxID=3906 RepID=A0AAV1AJI3_VICFA|nr:unnamed protein product [Vicia faba]CAI8610670.1 unnamed protein product [Vicia faba]
MGMEAFQPNILRKRGNFLPWEWQVSDRLILVGYALSIGDFPEGLQGGYALLRWSPTGTEIGPALGVPLPGLKNSSGLNLIGTGSRFVLYSCWEASRSINVLIARH